MLGDRDSQRIAADEKISTLFEQGSDVTDQSQKTACELTSDCTGPMHGKLESKLGTTAMVTLCGSASLELGTHQESVRVERGFSQPKPPEDYSI